MRMGSLFSGIGLFDLGLERSGLGSVAWQVEIDDWCRRVLTKHWPFVERHDDVKTFKPGHVDVVFGGFPCQPVSVAGKRQGDKDARWLWPEFARIIEATEAKIVVIENVPGLRTRGLRGVLSDLAGLGFDAEWTHFRASEIGAPHERNRLWLVATNPNRIDVRNEPGWLKRSIERRASAVAGYVTTRMPASNADGMRRLESARGFAELRGWARHCGWRLGEIARVDDGRSGKLDAVRRRKALGNAVVVQCAQAVGQALAELVGGAE